ncbi:MAG TPA: MFS transporter [Clostridiales bacterium]|nr:MFS transporter [Clostridiales bacterium]
MKNFGFKKLMIFIILSAAVAIAYQLPYLRYTFYDQMMAALQLNDTQMGFLATAVNIASVASYPIGGILANRFSLRKLINITLAAFVVLTIAFAFTTNYVLLLGIHVLYGFFGIATLWSAYLNGIRNLGDEKNQSTLFGSSEATRGIVQTLLGFAFLGIMGAAATPVMGFKTLLLVGTAVTGFFLILGLIFLPKDEKNEASAIKEGGEEEKYTIMDVLKNKGVWITCLVLMSAYLSWSLGNGYLTTYTVRVVGISTAMASTLGIIRSYIIVFVAGFLGGWVLDRFTYKGKAFLFLFGIIAALILGVMLSHKAVGLCIVLTLLVAFVANVMKSTYWSIMGQAGIPVKMTALATGIISFIIFMPDMIITPICGIWLDNATAAGNIAAGFNKIFILLIVFSIIGMISSVILTRRTKSLEAAKQKEAAAE